ncbi:MAG: hypothetical protein ACFE0O_02280 [Opitutales bacterium]
MRTDPANGPCLLGEKIGRVRRLPGFLKGGRHHEPDGFHDAALAFVRRIGHPLIAERTDALYRDFRDALGLKRRELGFSCEDGLGQVSAPDLTATLALDQAPEDPRSYRLQTYITTSCDPGRFRQPELLAVLAGRVTCLVLPLPQQPDLEATIDRIEDRPTLRPCLDYTPDASELTLQPADAPFRLTLTAESAVFSMPPGGPLDQLVAGALALWPQVAETLRPELP